ncbi:hypothetical protein Salat_2659700 [Sesamum alatum]|uniref:DUF4283 domain-containing protein n=1 Tax=Sesamum alatum TaxID=300844 RepID=A0AAE1XP81_9LAMI|nr:hypothetical protein Salat_2659700 [Sesamum alatum]
MVEDGTLTLESNDLVDVRAKLGHCLVGYIAGKFSGLKAIRTLAQSWGASFHQHDSGWLVFRFARDEDRQYILASGPYFIYGRSLLLKNMPDYFEFKEDDISVTPVWAILPSLPLECWHPNTLGKIESRLGTPIAMDSLTMLMERVSYACILVEVDASKKLVDQVKFILPNGVARKQPVVYEFTPKFCSECHHFGHLKHSCQGTQPLAAAAATTTAATVKTDQPGPSRLEQNSAGQGLITQTRRAVIEEQSLAGSSGSSSASGSPPMTEFVAPIALKQKQKLGGDAPPYSS